MKHTLTTLAAVLGLAAAGPISAQTAPVGGPDAKGNSPIKAAHTVNDGSAKPAANSFTSGQAKAHIEHSGYSGVTGLVKGRDGVWRGSAMKGGAAVNVALDFKGNVTEGMRPVAPARATSAPMAAPVATGTVAPEPAAANTIVHHHHRRHHRHHHGGVGKSGIDRNKNGISDKEDRALKNGHE